MQTFRRPIKFSSSSPNKWIFLFGGFNNEKMCLFIYISHAWHTASETMNAQTFQNSVIKVVFRIPIQCFHQIQSAKWERKKVCRSQANTYQLVEISSSAIRLCVCVCGVCRVRSAWACDSIPLHNIFICNDLLRFDGAAVWHTDAIENRIVIVVRLTCNKMPHVGLPLLCEPFDWISTQWKWK